MKPNTKVIGLGAGGHCKVMLEILRFHQNLEIVGLLSPDDSLNMLDGVPILGNDDWLENAASMGVTHFFLGVGTVKGAEKRKKLFELGKRWGLTPIQAIHPKSIVSSSVTLGEGVSIMAGAIINPYTVIGENVIVNTGANIDHDCHIGAHTHIAPGVTLSGAVQIGEGCMIGVGSTVRQGIHIGNNVIVGAGAVVVKDVADGETVVGVPAKPIRITS
ncbi:MAG: acetyltransferase [bacterium]|nr:acetyltransferase [bacterium]